MNDEDRVREIEPPTFSAILREEIRRNEIDQNNERNEYIENETDPDEETIELDLDYLDNLDNHPEIDDDSDDGVDSGVENQVEELDEHDLELDELIETVAVANNPFPGIPEGTMMNRDMMHVNRLFRSITEGFENLGVYHCPVCDESLTHTQIVGGREITMNVEEPHVYDHVWSHFVSGDLNHFVCTICSSRFESEYIYNLHLANHIDNGEYLEQEVDEDEDEDEYEDHDDWDSLSDSNSDSDNPYDQMYNLPYDVENDGEHVCPFCDRTYETEELLGEHFIRSHGSYDQLSNLASRRRAPFPGYACLIDVGMITYLDRDSYDLIVKEDETCTTCTICCLDYDQPEEKLGDPDSEADRNLSRPLKLMCCEQMICTSCVANHLKRMGILSCPYCRHDHTPKVDDVDSDDDELNPNEQATYDLTNAIEDAINSINMEDFIRSSTHTAQEIIDNPEDAMRLFCLMNEVGEPPPNVSYSITNNTSGYVPPTQEEVINASRASSEHRRMEEVINTIRSNPSIMRQLGEEYGILVDDIERLISGSRQEPIEAITISTAEEVAENEDQVRQRRNELLNIWDSTENVDTSNANRIEVSTTGPSDFGMVTEEFNYRTNENATEDNEDNEGNEDTEETADTTVDLRNQTVCPSYILNPGTVRELHVPDISWNRNRYARGVRDYNRLLSEFDSAINDDN